MLNQYDERFVASLARCVMVDKDGRSRFTRENPYEEVEYCLDAPNFFDGGWRGWFEI